MTGLWDFIFYILNLSQNRSKSKLVRENAMTRAPGSYSLYVMGSCPRIFLGLKFSIPGYFWGAVLHAHAYLAKKKTTVHESCFAESFFGFPNRTVKRKSMKSGFGCLN